jgi:hypothetical protein
MGIGTIFKILVETGQIFAALNDGGMPNIPMPTMGGVIFWDDIQNVMVGDFKEILLQDIIEF